MNRLKSQAVNLSLLFGGLLSILGCATSNPVGERWGRRTLTDINNDSIVDLLEYRLHKKNFISDYELPLVLYTSLGKPDGSFSSPNRAYSGEPKSTGIYRVKDFDKDSFKDLIIHIESRDFVTGYPSYAADYFAKGNGDGTFEKPIKLREWHSESGQMKLKYENKEIHLPDEEGGDGPKIYY